jgi:hypothetical protein
MEITSFWKKSVLPKKFRNKKKEIKKNINYANISFKISPKSTLIRSF